MVTTSLKVFFDPNDAAHQSRRCRQPYLLLNQSCAPMNVNEAKQMIGPTLFSIVATIALLGAMTAADAATIRCGVSVQDVGTQRENDTSVEKIIDIDDGDGHWT